MLECEITDDIIKTSFGDMPIKMSLKGSTELVVLLSGAIQRKKKSPPVYQRETWLTALPFSAIAIADETLLLNNSIELGWYLGDAGGDILKKLILSLYYFFNHHNFSFNNIIFYGSSGGGFAAALLATYFRGSRVIMINPQTDISKYHSAVYQKFMSTTHYQKHYTHSLMELFYQKRFIPNIQYLQNTQDTFHYREHYLPLMSWFAKTNLAINNNSGLISFLEYSMKGGHGGLHNTEDSNDFIVKYITDTYSSKPANYHKLMPIKTQFITVETFAEEITMRIKAQRTNSKLVMYYDEPIDKKSIENLLSQGWILSDNIQVFKYISLASIELIKTINTKELSFLPYFKIKNWFSGCNIDIAIQYH
ncbi:hypothetical protein [Shewanella surugensis]|uniref:Uncharacterized protein n=1 Tax=Shewanella surugensis TaxID=212020 RepID=A0ABT0LGQ7_9GAMM|nr:hypothetical protein [Shewanella surugensis]MCL1126845.1 hypothetical protein [Shewanella surugensis]